MVLPFAIFVIIGVVLVFFGLVIVWNCGFVCVTNEEKQHEQHELNQQSRTLTMRNRRREGERKPKIDNRDGGAFFTSPPHKIPEEE